MIKNRIKVAKNICKIKLFTASKANQLLASWLCLFSDNGASPIATAGGVYPLAWRGQSLLSTRRCKMCKGLGFSTGFVALCAFICCFGALHMLNKIVHINEEVALRTEYKLPPDESDRCQRTFIVDGAGNAHITWLELFYMKWTLVLTIFYTFIVMVLIRAQYLSHFDINFITSNAVSISLRLHLKSMPHYIFASTQMMLVGGVLSVVLFIATVILHERMPFMEVWCNEFIVGFMYFIAINICVAVVFFLIHSCQYYFQLEERGF
ncbi:uncharacterized protein Dvir_GJ18711, isoform B [Drosophila virilis]|uniref:Uncharacterized protein, isoform B n=1 Tax=Drosophila virilis TaxID=7244 RepID=A0A0Q9WMW1_DROVI|nr:uncharacterized protein Dvir_GJ18711, isoform B [Drosophila virilis]